MLWHTVGWREGSEVVMPYRQILSKHMKVTDRLGLRSAHVVLQFPEIIGNISNKNVPAPCKMSENGLQMSVLTMLICFFFNNLTSGQEVSCSLKLIVARFVTLRLILLPLDRTKLSVSLFSLCYCLCNKCYLFQGVQ